MAALEVTDATGFEAGQEISIYDIAAGDRVSAPTTVTLHRNGGGFDGTASRHLDVQTG